MSKRIVCDICGIQQKTEESGRSDFREGWINIAEGSITVFGRTPEMMAHSNEALDFCGVKHMTEWVQQTKNELLGGTVEEALA